jgi:hypothetical protein
MRKPLVRLLALCGIAAWLWFSIEPAAGPNLKAAPAPEDKGLVVHEWGTFTSFSGSDGVPAHFTPDNSDLPGFVYYQEGSPNEKVTRLEHDGTVSMETPVMYFYSAKALRASIKIDFPKGWITEWYPFAATPPAEKRRQGKSEGQSIRWDVKLLAGQAGKLPHEQEGSRYYEARETDSVPLEVGGPKDDDKSIGRGKVQQEKFLFYRGVGNFPPPVTIQALGKDKIRYKNGSGGRVAALVLVTVHDRKVGFKTLDPLDSGADGTATLPEARGDASDVAAQMVKELTAAGLYEKEARAMVKTWESSWFDGEGSRLLYLVPQSRTDELLRLSIDPKPAEVVRVIVGRHDFLTPEQEANVDKLVTKLHTLRDPGPEVEKELAKIGRFAPQARAMAEKRFEDKKGRK